MNRDQIYPIDLLIAGAQKSGTSSLKEYLGQHPQISTHHQLEMAYFSVDKLYNQGYEQIFFRYFKVEPIHTSLLAKNVDVMYNEVALKRVMQHNNKIKIVIILRNPIDRAYSAYWYHRRTGWETIPTFEDAIFANSDRFGDDDIKRRGCAYLERSIYTKHLVSLQKYFPKEQVQIFLLEDMKKNAVAFCQQIFDFMGNINPDFAPNTEKTFNLSALPKNRLIANLTYSPTHFSTLKNFLRKVLPNQFADTVRNRIINLNEKSFKPPPINRETRLLLAKYFYTYNRQLEEYIDRDLNHWDVDL